MPTAAPVAVVMNSRRLRICRLRGADYMTRPRPGLIFRFSNNQTRSHLSESDVNAGADVRNIVLEELAIRRRPLVPLEQQHDQASRMVLGTRPPELQPRPPAHGWRPVMQL